MPLPVNSNPKNNLSTEIATLEKLFGSGTFMGFSRILPNPDPILRKLGRTEEAYSDIMADAHLFGCVQSRKAGVLSQEWEIYQDKSKKTVHKEISEMFNDFNLDEITRQILDTPLYGFNPIEIVWEKTGKYFLPVKIQSKPREWFEFDIDGNLMLSMMYGTQEPINKYKFLIPRHEASLVNPYGIPLLAKCYWNVMYKKHTKKFWAVFSEKYGMPYLLGKYTNAIASSYNIDIEDAPDKFLDSLSSLVADGIIVYPEGSDVTIQATGSVSSVEIYERLIESCKAENSELLLGHKGASLSTPGQLGNENAAIQVREDIITMDKRLVEQTYNQLIKWIFELNFNEPQIPVFRFYEEEDINMELATRDGILTTQVGVKFTKDYLKVKYDLKETDFELAEIKPEEPITPVVPIKETTPTGDNTTPNELPPAQVDENINADPDKPVPEFSEKSVNAQIELDKFIKSLQTPEIQSKLMNDYLKPLLNFVEKTDSLETMATNYHKLFPNMPSTEIMDFIEKVNMIGHLHGQKALTEEL